MSFQVEIVSHRSIRGVLDKAVNAYGAVQEYHRGLASLMALARLARGDYLRDDGSNIDWVNHRLAHIFLEVQPEGFREGRDFVPDKCHRYTFQCAAIGLPYTEELRILTGLDESETELLRCVAMQEDGKELRFYARGEKIGNSSPGHKSSGPRAVR